MKKKLFAIFLTVAALMALLAFTASASNLIASGNCGGEGDGSNLKWSITADGTLIFSGSGSWSDKVGSACYGEGDFPWASYSSSIKAVILPSGLEDIWLGFFSELTNLQSISISGDDTYFTRDGVLFMRQRWGGIDDTGNTYMLNAIIFYPPAKPESSYTIPSDVQIVDIEAFKNAQNLVTITIPYHADFFYISAFSAFSNCKNLTAINVASGNTRYCSIDGVLYRNIDEDEDEVFDALDLIAYPAGKTNTTYTMPDNVIGVESEAFYGIEHLKRIVVSSNFDIHYCCANPFSGIGANTSVYFSGDCWAEYVVHWGCFGHTEDGTASSCTVYYPAGNSTWTQESRDQMGENNNITWKSYDPATTFIDVLEFSDYHYSPVYWANGKKIATGTEPGRFSPEKGCTRAQVVTFLWRAAGEPEPTSTVSPFIDVQNSSAYYYKAVLWAVEKGITTGATETTFDPESTCTRAQIVTFLWRYESKPSAGGSNPFVDVPSGEYYSTPVLWAVEKGITKGTGANTFSPADTCTRAQVVTFLYRDLA